MVVVVVVVVVEVEVVLGAAVVEAKITNLLYNFDSFSYSTALKTMKKWIISIVNVQ